jgi:hypothetical protein
MPLQTDMLVEAHALGWLLMDDQLTLPIRKAGKYYFEHCKFKSKIRVVRARCFTRLSAKAAFTDHRHLFLIGKR